MVRVEVVTDIFLEATDGLSVKRNMCTREKDVSLREKDVGVRREDVGVRGEILAQEKKNDLGAIKIGAGGKNYE